MGPKRTRHSAGFSLVEVMLAVVILGVTGLALLDGLQGSLLQTRRISVHAGTAIALDAAVDNIEAAPYVSCSVNAAPYATLPSGLALPTGITVSVQEFVPTASPAWQTCQNTKTAGSAQSIVLTAADGTTRSMMRFASTSAAASGSPTSTPLSATAVPVAKTACSAFAKSSQSNPCVITMTSSSGSGATWRISSITFAGGDFFNPAPTASVTQATAITISTYTLDGGKFCKDKTTPIMAISFVDDGNGSTTTAYPVITC